MIPFSGRICCYHWVYMSKIRSQTEKCSLHMENCSCNSQNLPFWTAIYWNILQSKSWLDASNEFWALVPCAKSGWNSSTFIVVLYAWWGRTCSNSDRNSTWRYVFRCSTHPMKRSENKCDFGHRKSVFQFGSCIHWLLMGGSDQFLRVWQRDSFTCLSVEYSTKAIVIFVITA